MSGIRYIATLIYTLWLFSAAQAANFKADLLVDTPEGSKLYGLTVQGDNYTLNWQKGDSSLNLQGNINSDKVWLYNQENDAFEPLSGAQAAFVSPIIGWEMYLQVMQLQEEATYRETIDGYSCRKTSYSLYGKIVFERWYAEDLGFYIKQEYNIDNNQGLMELSHIKMLTEVESSGSDTLEYSSDDVLTRRILSAGSSFDFHLKNLGNITVSFQNMVDDTTGIILNPPPKIANAIHSPKKHFLLTERSEGLEFPYRFNSLPAVLNITVEKGMGTVIIKKNNAHDDKLHSYFLAFNDEVRLNLDKNKILHLNIANAQQHDAEVVVMPMKLGQIPGGFVRYTKRLTSETPVFEFNYPKNTNVDFILVKVQRGSVRVETEYTESFEEYNDETLFKMSAGESRSFPVDKGYPFRIDLTGISQGRIEASGELILFKAKYHQPLERISFQIPQGTGRFWELAPELEIESVEIKLDRGEVDISVLQQ